MEKCMADMNKWYSILSTYIYSEKKDIFAFYLHIQEKEREKKIKIIQPLPLHY